MKKVFPQQFTDLIARTLGLHVREQEQSLLWHKLLKRTQVLGLPSVESYYELLTSKEKGAIATSEWHELINLLTVNESYFFRDQGQFSLLRHQVVPEIIKRKRNSHSRPSIRVWSAGCSTGEEAYSLAILLKELIPADEEWSILVLGTDVNESALKQARQGIYSDWSFRLVHSRIQKDYFRHSRHGWEIDPAIRCMVTFQYGNLVQDAYPSAESNIHDLDLILCRNVFIYFGREAVTPVLDRFYRALTPGGYLMTGHTELYGQNLNPFKVITFPESVVYQRPIKALHLDPVGTEGDDRSPFSSQSSNLNNAVPLLWQGTSGKDSESLRVEVLAEPATQVQAEPLPKPLPIAPRSLTLNASPMPPAKRTAPFAMLVDEVVALMECKAYAEAILKANELITQDPQHVHAYYLMAEAYANLGDHSNATRICHQVLQSTPFAVEPFYLLAQIAQEQGDLEGAKALLKRVIYLAPTSAYAYFELGCLYEHQGNMAKARRSWQSALEILKPMSQQTGVGLRNNLTVAELRAATEQKLNRPTLT